MSGPMAASFGIEAGVLAAAASIAQGAAEIATGLAEAERETQAVHQQRREARRQMRAARAAGEEKRQQVEAARLARYQHLKAALEKLGHATDAFEGPDQPVSASETARADWIAGLDERITRLETALEAEVARRGGELAHTVEALLTQAAAAATPLAGALDHFLIQARLAGASVDEAFTRRTLVERVLDRLALPEGAPLPPALDALARQIVEASTSARADALATELRLRVQQHNDALHAAAEEKALREAAAVVLEQSLKDLGYAVEDIEETLFVEGGVVHFQRPGWDDHFIRLRIDPQRQTMNFNVVRAGVRGEDRRHEDFLAEERWCSEFPRLFDTLKARGIPITVTRLLQAGEAPVQIVDVASLPARSDDTRQDAPLQARSLS